METSELRKIERKFYRNLCDYGVETLKLATISKEELSRRLVFKEQQIPQQFARQNQSILILASHHFNWEWLLVGATIDYPFEMDFVYQPVRSKGFDRFIVETRSRWGAYAIKRDEVAREMVRRKGILRGIATVADQYPGYSHDKKYHARFLNQDTVFFYGTNQLALMTQYPTLYYQLRKIKRGYYEATPVIIGHPPYAKGSETVIENYVREVEKMINETPETWLWSHKRWKKRHVG